MKSLTLIRLFVLRLVLVVTAGLASANLINNPGFETGDFTGWTPSGSLAVNNFNPHSGTFAAQFFLAGSLSQTVATIAGVTYDFSFWSNDSSAGSLTGLTLNGVGIALPDGGFPPYQQFALSFLATGSTTFTFTLNSGYFLDDVSLTAQGGTGVPDTGSSALLLGLSLAGILSVPCTLPKLFRFRIA